MPVAPWESEQTSCVAANRGAERDKRLGLLRHGLLKVNNCGALHYIVQLICRLAIHPSGKPSKVRPEIHSFRERNCSSSSFLPGCDTRPGCVSELAERGGRKPGVARVCCPQVVLLNERMSRLGTPQSGLAGVFNPGASMSPRAGSPRNPGRPESPRSEAARLQRMEEENDRLRSEVTRLKAGVVYMASSGPGGVSASPRGSRGPTPRPSSPRIPHGTAVPRMEQERMVRA